MFQLHILKNKNNKKKTNNYYKFYKKKMIKEFVIIIFHLDKNILNSIVFFCKIKGI